MNVGSIMQENVVTVAMDDFLFKVAEIFNTASFHHLLVVEGRKLIGVISDRDLLKVISPYVGTASELQRDVETVQKRAHQIMSRRVIAVRPDVTIAAAARLLLEKDVSCLPVTSDNDDLLGIVTWKDLLISLVSEAEPEKG